MRKINWKNVGWFVSTLINRVAYVMFIHDLYVMKTTETMMTTFLWNHTAIGGFLLLGWVWSVYRNGFQPFASTYVIEWKRDCERKKRGCRIIWIDRHDPVDRIAK